MDYVKLLEQLDDRKNWECPPHFQYEDAVRRFREFTTELERELKSKLTAETESHIQDASFHSQILVEHSWIRFSNFGNLVAISNEEMLAPPVLKSIQQLLGQRGYTYIPEAVLEATYVKKDPGIIGIRNWWGRFFDWL